VPTTRPRPVRTTLALLLCLPFALAAAPTDTEAPPDDADCLEGEAWVSTDGGATRRYLLGPNHCVAPTPFPAQTIQREEGNGSIRVGFGIGVPLP
jgi:hypothetical protein